MLENILKLEGVQELNKTEQKNIVAASAAYYEYQCYRTCVKYNGGSAACRRKCYRYTEPRR